jgi:hypothetical protein
LRDFDYTVVRHREQIFVAAKGEFHECADDDCVDAVIRVLDCHAGNGWGSVLLLVVLTRRRSRGMESTSVDGNALTGIGSIEFRDGRGSDIGRERRGIHERIQSTRGTVVVLVLVITSPFVSYSAGSIQSHSHSTSRLESLKPKKEPTNRRLEVASPRRTREWQNTTTTTSSSSRSDRGG